MLLEDAANPDKAAALADDAMTLIRAAFPLCRSITGNGVRHTFDLVERLVPLVRSEVPTGTAAFDWEVPNEWNIDDAYIADENGRRIVDFASHNLHVVSYSAPVKRNMTLEELQAHLHSDPERPEVIPYRTTYYREGWGFCLSHRQRSEMRPGRYEVVIDSTLAPGSLSYAECVVPGQTAAEGIVYTHTCHPSLVNDNLSGIAVAAVLARALRTERPRLTWRFVFGPGTIGSLVWLARNEPRLGQVATGFTLGLLGTEQPITYKRTRQGTTVTDRAGAHVIGGMGGRGRVVDWEPYGYDERQFCSPGIDLPIGRVCRALHGEYREYHTSADDLSLVSSARLAEAIGAVACMLGTLDANRRMLNLSPKGEPRLGKRGLYRFIGGSSPKRFEEALLWVLSLSDGNHDMLSIAERGRLDFPTVVDAVEALSGVGLLAELDEGVGQHDVTGAGQ